LYRDERPFEFNHGPDDLKHQAAGWRGEVKVISQADECDSTLF
jgi:hypothetical protein